MADEKKSYLFKVCCVGDGAVGKTSMVLRYCENKFQENYIMTIGSNFAIKKIDLPELNTEVKLQIWDLAGQEHFSFVRPPFYRGASGLIYVFDITRRETFENIEKWYKEVENVIPGKPFVLVGNKIDLVDERVVARKEGEELAAKFGEQCLGYFETSAKTSEGLDEMFMTLTKALLKAK